MKRFTADAIKDRLKKRAEKDADSATILDDSAFSVIMDVVSEGFAEIARYIEYDTMEKKWTNAQNLPSLTHMGKLIGRKRRRPTSAIGYVVVSHKDINGKQRLPNFNSYFFDLDQTSDYDNITQDGNANYIQKAALVPWTCADVYTIPKGTIFTSTNNIPFISTAAVSTRILSMPYSTIIASSSRYNEFLSAGGWDGIKYVRVPVIQGVQRELDLGTAAGTRFQAFVIPESNVEGAYNDISREYFYVEVTPPGANTKPEKWAEIPNIRLAGPYDKVYETKLSEDGNSVIIKFGDGVSGYLPAQGSSIKVHYLETMGAAGNLDQAGLIDGSSFQFPTGFKKIDPRTNVLDEEFLYALNTLSISGGRDIEDSNDYRLNAPTSYLQSYTTAVKAAYEEQIMKVSPVLLSKLKCFPDSTFTANQVDTSYNEDVNDEIANEISVISNALNVTAIKADGTKFDNNMVQEEFIQPVIKTIGDLKGPNDTLTYIEPNFIKVAPSLKINTYDLNTTEEEIRNKVSAAVTAKYSIFNTDFKNPFYSSDLTYQASLLGFTESVNLQVEALANVSFEKDDIMILFQTNGNTVTLTETNWKQNIVGDLVAIPFKFDPIFASNKYKQGFKNYKVNSNYLLKVDLKFINNPNRSSDSKTFFLYDNRKSDISLQDAKMLDLEGNPIAPYGSREQVQSKIGISSLTFPKETDNGFNNRQARIAQFNYINNITDDEFMSKAKSFTTQPYENRPYEVGADGNYNIFMINAVSSSDQAPITLDGTISSVCYKYNHDWWPYVDIIFNENYDNPSDSQYASGYVVLPLSYLGLNSSINTSTESFTYTTLSSLLKQFIDIKVYAIPKMEDIEPENWNDIIFIDAEDIKVERNLKYQK